VKTPVTYILIDRAVLKATSLVKPDGNKKDWFLSFIPVSNPEIVKIKCDCYCHKSNAIIHIVSCCNNGFIDLQRDGIYPAPTGMMMEVRLDNLEPIQSEYIHLVRRAAVSIETNQ